MLHTFYFLVTGMVATSHCVFCSQIPDGNAKLNDQFPTVLISNIALNERIFVIRETKTKSLNNQTFDLTLRKINGYSVDLRFEGEDRSLKVGETIIVPDGNCKVTFQEIATETRLARFSTNCP